MMEFIRGRRREGRTGSSDGFSLGLLETLLSSDRELWPLISLPSSPGTTK